MSLLKPGRLRLPSDLSLVSPGVHWCCRREFSGTGHPAEISVERLCVSTETRTILLIERHMRWGGTLLGTSLHFLFTENLDQMPSTIVSHVTLDLH